MIDKRGLQSVWGKVTTAPGDTKIGVVVGTEVASNMRRYIYKIKTNNQYAGANQLRLGYSDDEGETATTLDYIDHATEHEMWNDPDELKEDALPIYIIPSGNKIFGVTDNGDCYVYFLYEDSE